MVSTVTQNLFATTYKDDYRDSDNYHRILFNSRRALQARELTQMQTIIQNEIARFGRNIFKEGAAVNPGGPTIDPTYEFIKLDPVNSLPTNPDTLVGAIYYGSSSNLKFQVLQVVPAENGDPATLYVKYLGDNSGGSSTSLRATRGENLFGTSVPQLKVQTTDTANDPAVGRGVRFSCGQGDFFAQGHFVFVESQSIILSKYNSDYTGVVGFIVTEEVVTVVDDPALYDNQGAVPNTTAPGADRYRIRLTLIDQANVDSDQKFVFYANVRNSEIIQVVTGSDDYNKINDLLALRTKEESGNYIVRQFKLKFDEDSSAGFLIADVSPGTAYINGYRANTAAPTRIRVQKPTTTEVAQNEVVAANYGNYVEVSTLRGVPNVNELELWNLRSATAYGGSTIGTARINHVVEDGSIYKYYLSDIKMTGTNSFRSVRSIGLSATRYADVILTNSEAVLNDPANRDLLFSLPRTRPALINDISLQVQKQYTPSVNGVGDATITAGTGETWVNTTDWVVTKTGSADSNISSSVTITGAGTSAATIGNTGLTSGTISVLAYVNKSNGSPRAKTLTETTILGSVESDGNGIRFVSLRQADIFNVSRIRLNDSNGTDLSGSFNVDNGQRDDYYGIGRLVLRFGRSVPAGSVFARFKYFAHGAGDFFAINSYSGIPYKDIPSYTLSNGEVIDLRDVLDFRSRIDSSGSSFAGATARVNVLPAPTDLVQMDATYYLPRNDKLVINEQGVVSFVEGAPSAAPKYPSTPSNTLDLYNIQLNANTISTTDLGLTAIDHKRFTMSDIARLEKRVDRLEEYTTLSLLEVDAQTISVVDSSGLPRTKAGFLADKFSDQFYSDTTANDYRASIDPRENVLRPTTSTKNIRLIYDSAQSTNTVRKGDIVYLKHTEDLAISQDFVSGSENVNPFSVSFNTGYIVLSPSSDEWKETVYLPAKLIDNGIRLDADEALLFNVWQWNWQGLAAADNDLTGVVLAQRWRRTPRRRRAIDRVVSDETIREVVDDRIVDVALIPFMRSRRVYFKAVGLIPFQRYFPFFDEVSVSDWVKQESFVQFGEQEDDYGDRYRASTQHPFGKTTILTTDVNGTLEGSFFIPAGREGSNTVPRFRSGSRVFKLLNVSVNDEAAATSAAFATFTSQGVLETRQETIETTRTITVVGTRPSRPRRIDPLAQSFLVPQEEGMFITKVRVYFKSKPGGTDTPAPVILQIRPLVNGVPSSDAIVPGSDVVKIPSQVNLPPTETKADILATPTDFVFDEPLYLQGNTEYAVVLLSDSNKYRVYVAEAGAFEINSTERRIGTQPSLGSLFLSQNGSTWTPDQTRDMMFRIYKATFDTTTTGYAILENAAVPFAALENNPLMIDSGSRWITVAHPNHGFDSGDAVKIFGLDSAATYGGVRGTSIMGTRNIRFPDASGFQVYIDSSPSSSVFAGGQTVIAQQNMLFDILNPHIDALVVDNTSISYEGRFTTGRSLAGGEQRFLKDTIANYSPIAVKEDNYAAAPNIIANNDVEASQMGGEKSATIRVTLSTTSPNVTPYIDLQRCSLIAISNIIDRQDSDRTNTIVSARVAGSGKNTPLIYVPETDPDDGSHVAKHITVPVTLAETAVGLKILLAANRPSVAELDVYYRTATGGANIRTVDWTLLSPEAPIPSDDNPTVFREYRYLAGGLGGSLSPFTQYQLKIVFKSPSSSKVPSVRDLRVIALAV